MTASAPRFSSAAERLSLLCTRARTLSPRASASLTEARPVSPVAPVINTVRVIICFCWLLLRWWFA
jgi:hypothetical protein